MQSLFAATLAVKFSGQLPVDLDIDEEEEQAEAIARLSVFLQLPEAPHKLS